ncbi:MAG: DUF3305 domain-containing protein [Methylobacteriaceae bacterium]|nr:DUF3305 domain-containing protein [Methylobacteriaceae bacterium]
MSGDMPESCFEVGILVAKRKLKGPWASHAWLPCAILPAAPAANPWTRLSASEQEEIFYAGSFEVSLHPSETAHYRDNLRSERPSLWVALRHVGGDDYEIAAVTANPYEGESMAEGIGEIVEAVPMTLDIQAKVAEFFAAFHQERPFVKRKLDPIDPEALARGGPRLSRPDER